nr:hypothetical protein [Marinicella sp. W31]MDC2878135.1 hypothetical protein [Marinicella sp. W31]
MGLGCQSFRADILIDEYRRLDPQTVEAVSEALALADRQTGRTLLADRPFGSAKAAATESVVFENSDKVLLAPASISWSDVGSWRSLFEIGAKDDDGNVFTGDVVPIDTHQAYVRAASGRLIATVGVENLAIVDTDDALLVASLDRTQDVRRVLEMLEQRTREEHVHSEPPRQAAETPLSSGKGYRVSEIDIAVGAAVTLPPIEAENRMLTVGCGLVQCERGGDIARKSPGIQSGLLPVAPACCAIVRTCRHG